jgi:hypothetical protein
MGNTGPSVSEQQQAKDSPTSLSGTDFIKMVAIDEESLKSSEQERRAGEQGDGERGKPQPPFASGEQPQVFLALLCVKAAVTGERQR